MSQTNDTSVAEPTHHYSRKSWHDDDYWESRLFSALGLVLVGFIFLGNTTGIVPWSIWLNIFKFWPLFIVSAGVGILFSGTRLLKFIGSALGFVIFAGIVVLAFFSPNRLSWPSILVPTNQQAIESTSTVAVNDFKDVKTKQLNVDLPLGKITVANQLDSDFLNISSKHYNDFEKPLVSSTLGDGLLKTSIAAKETKSFWLNTRGPEYSINLGKTALPLDLFLKLGTGDILLQLDKQLLGRLRTEVGAGNVNIDLTNPAIPTKEISLKAGVGNIDIKLPAYVGIGLNYKVGLGNVTVNNTSISKGAQEATYQTENYEKAEYKLTFSAEVGVGNITLTNI